MPYFSTWAALSAPYKTLQNHIHISIDRDECGDIAHPAHSLTRFALRERILEPKAIMSMHRGLNNNLHVHRAITGNTPVQLVDYSLTVICKPAYGFGAYERSLQLTGMNGRVIYFIDSYHPNNDEAHTDHVKRMVLEVMSIPQFDHNLQRYEIDVKLHDHNIGFT